MIIFLDFDGVISTTRAYMSQMLQDDFHLRWLDPIACAFLRRICEQFSCKIVVTSTWRKFGYNICVEKSLAEHDLAKFVHNNWHTEDLWSCDMDSLLSRPLEIASWLSKNGNENTEYIILDDDSFKWYPHQKERWIRTSVEDGLLMSQMQQIIYRVEMHTGLKFSEWENENKI